MTATLLIVDDHPGFRKVARQLLELEGFDVIGEAQDGAEALRAATELRPDVVLLDVHLPDLNGFTVARQLTHDPGDAPAVILTSSLDVSDVDSALLDSGARGFLPKSELSGDALAALIG